MPLVQAKCEGCGGILTVDSNLKAAICPHCGSAYVVQDSINYYNSVTKIENMHADVVNVSDESTSEGRLKAADAYMKMKKYAEAEAEYRNVTELAPQNYLGWCGLISSFTCEFTRRIKAKKDFSDLEEYANSAKIMAPGGESDSTVQKLGEYLAAQTELNNEEIKKLNDTISRMEEEEKQLHAKEIDLDGKLSQLVREHGKIQVRKARYDNQRANNVTDYKLLAFFIFLIFGGFFALLAFIFSKISPEYAISNTVLTVIACIFFALAVIIFIWRLVDRSHVNKTHDAMEIQEFDLSSEIETINTKKNACDNRIASAREELKQYD